MRLPIIQESSTTGSSLAATTRFRDGRVGGDGEGGGGCELKEHENRVEKGEQATAY